MPKRMYSILSRHFGDITLAPQARSGRRLLGEAPPRVRPVSRLHHRRKPDRTSRPPCLAGGADLARCRLYGVGDLSQGRRIHARLRGTGGHPYLSPSAADRGGWRAWLRARIQHGAVLGIPADDQGQSQNRLRRHPGLQSAGYDFPVGRVLENADGNTLRLRSS